MNIVMVPLISQPRSIALADSYAPGKKIEALPTGSQEEGTSWRVV